MRRVVILGALVLVGALSVVGVVGQQGQMMVETEKLEDNLYVLRGGGGNSAAFITSDGVVLGRPSLPERAGSTGPAGSGSAVSPLSERGPGQE